MCVCVVVIGIKMDHVQLYMECRACVHRMWVDAQDTGLVHHRSTSTASVCACVAL